MNAEEQRIADLITSSLAKALESFVGKPRDGANRSALESVTKKKLLEFLPPPTPAYVRLHLGKNVWAEFQVNLTPASPVTSEE